MERQNRAQKLANAIRASIDSYPGGLCFASADGRPILVNKRMNELVSWLTGHTVLDARAAWEELSNAPLPPDCRRLDQPWLPRDAEDGDHRQLFFALPDGTVWQFHRQLLTDEEPPTVQIEATEMTELFSLSQELYENNLRLLELQCRQRALLENIVQINREKELLSAKLRIHDELGRCLLATKRFLAEPGDLRQAEQIRQAWKKAIRDFSNIPLTSRGQDISPQAELLAVARMIGCQLHFSGAEPTEKRALHLLYAAVREGLTNAVRHGGADSLKVDVRETAEGWHVEIENNGSLPDVPIREGEGLGSLRRRLEEEGATLSIRCGDRVRLVVEIPSEQKWSPGR